MTRPTLVLLGVSAFALAGLALAARSPDVAPTDRTDNEKLFFALEVRDGNKLLARPKLVGVEGKPLKLYLTHPDTDHSLKLALQLDPTRQADSSDYRIGVTLTIPGLLTDGQNEVRLGNGEERQIAWAGMDGPVTLKVMLMRVSSPEFKAYIDLGSRTPGDRRT
jgi:hypothetical protein